MRTALIVPVKGTAGCWGHRLGVTRVDCCFIFHLILFPSQSLWVVVLCEKWVGNIKRSEMLLDRLSGGHAGVVWCWLTACCSVEQSMTEGSWSYPLRKWRWKNKSNRNKLFLNSSFLWLVEDLSGEAECVPGMRLCRLAGITHIQVWDYVASVLQAKSLMAAKMPNASLIVYFMAADLLWHYLIFL